MKPSFHSRHSTKDASSIASSDARHIQSLVRNCQDKKDRKTATRKRQAAWIVEVPAAMGRPGTGPHDGPTKKTHQARGTTRSNHCDSLPGKLMGRGCRNGGLASPFRHQRRVDGRRQESEVEREQTEPVMSPGTAVFLGKMPSGDPMVTRCLLDLWAKLGDSLSSAYPTRHHPTSTLPNRLWNFMLNNTHRVIGPISNLHRGHFSLLENTPDPSCTAPPE